MIQYGAVRAVLTGLQAIPVDVSRRLGRELGRLVYLIDAPHRRRTLKHLRMAYGDDLRGGSAETVALGVFEHVGGHVADVVHVLRRKDFPIRLENPNVLMDAYRRGRGVVVVMAHMGSFALLSLLPRLMGFRAAAIMKKQTNTRLFRWATDGLQRLFDLRIVLKNHARDEVEHLLSDGLAVAFAADQHPRNGGFPATFFGRPVTVAAGPSVYAQRCDSPIVVLTTARLADGSHRMRFDGPVSTAGSLEEVSQRWTTILEARIREHPEQWLWMHRRWRTDRTAGQF
ncbi:MAG: lysophospholipid acyltransferase family protein [Planctomycetes bacterium]|nr:lysophospholipid acyltransferase family protein [Planctomycetota bacterium]